MKQYRIRLRPCCAPNLSWQLLPTDTPTAIRRLLRRALRRDLKSRLHDIADARLEIEEAGQSAGTVYPPSPSYTNYLLAGLTRIPCGGRNRFVCSLRWKAPQPTSARLMRLNVDLGADADLTTFGGPHTILSADGTRLIYTAKNKDGQTMLFRRALDEPEGTPLVGTEGASTPFLSANGQSVGFFALGKLRKAQVQGGGSAILCDAPAGRGGTWSEDGSHIIASLTTFAGLSLIPAHGGSPQPLTKLQPGEHSHRWPQVLPGGKAVLFTSARSAGNYEDAQVEVLLLPAGTRRVLARGAFFGRYVASGHLLYIHQGTLFADRFDLDHLEVAGKPVQLLTDVDNSPTSGYAQFNTSNSGTMIFVPGSAMQHGRSIAWLEASGKVRALPLAPGLYQSPRAAPDGKRIALTVIQNSRNIWVYDTERDSMTRLTFSSGGSLFQYGSRMENASHTARTEACTRSAPTAVPNHNASPIAITPRHPGLFHRTENISHL